MPRDGAPLPWSAAHAARPFRPRCSRPSPRRACVPHARERSAPVSAPHEKNEARRSLHPRPSRPRAASQIALSPRAASSRPPLRSPPLPERGARAVPPPRCRGDAKAQGSRRREPRRKSQSRLLRAARCPSKKKTDRTSSRFRGPERENAERANPTISRSVEHFALAPAGATFSFREGFWGCFSFSFLNGGAAAGAPGHTRCACGRAVGELRCGGGGGWGTRRRSSAHVGGPGAEGSF